MEAADGDDADHGDELCAALEVEAVVAAARHRIVGIDTHVLEGGFRSRVYWVVRPAGEPGA